MNKKTASEILAGIENAIPGLEAAVYSRDGLLLGSTPASFRQSPPPSGSAFSTKGSRFSGSMELEDKSVISYRGRKKADSDPEVCHRMIGCIVRLVMKKELLNHRLQLQREISSVFVERLFNLASDVDNKYLLLSATFHGYDMSLKRLVILLDFVIPPLQPYLPLEYTDSAIRSIRMMSEMGKQDLVGKLGDHQIVICKTCDLSVRSVTEFAAPFMNSLRLLFPADKVWISAGSFCDQPGQYSTSLSHAQDALGFARRFGSETGICYYEEYLTEYEISSLPEEMLHHFFSRLADKVLESSWMFETIEALVQSSMNQKEAAARLFIHRNTLVFRFNQIRDLLRLDPYTNDGDRFTLIAFCIYMKLYKRNM